MNSIFTVSNSEPANDLNTESSLAHSLPIGSQYPNSRRRNSAGLFSPTLRRRLKRLAPWLLSGGILGLELVLHQPAFVLGVSLFGLASMTVKALLKSNPTVQRLFKRVGLSTQAFPVLSIAFAGGLWFTAATLSQALFFQAAEQFFLTQFPQAATAVPLVFAVLRALFVLYIGVSLIRVINSVRNDDDWQTIARTPLMVAVCVSVGEVLTNLIIV
jgi:hypothetical protein